MRSDHRAFGPLRPLLLRQASDVLLGFFAPELFGKLVRRSQRLEEELPGHDPSEKSAKRNLHSPAGLFGERRYRSNPRQIDHDGEPQATRYETVTCYGRLTTGHPPNFTLHTDVLPSFASAVTCSERRLSAARPTLPALIDRTGCGDKCGGWHGFITNGEAAP